jgi:DNA-binding MarR family transcriptional regulator
VVDGDDELPLTALLSQTLVAFTIEFDNEFERRMPHRTTTAGATTDRRGAPWLVSLAMWATCVRVVPDEGIAVSELLARARTPTNLHGMRRWGYVTVDERAGGDPLVRPTRAGRAARAIWEPLAGTIEARWRAQFGDPEIEALRVALAQVVGQIEVGLPDCLPIVGYGLSSGDRVSPGHARPDERPSELPLFALLSRALLTQAIDYERGSELSLAIAANVLRVLDDEGVQLRELPYLGGVSKEAVAMAVGILEKRGLAVVEPGAAGGRFKVVVPTDAGGAAQQAHHELLAAIERDARVRFGEDALRELRRSLEQLPLGELALYDDGWRASRPMPASLAYFPIVLHRGGFPDGS